MKRVAKLLSLVVMLALPLSAGFAIGWAINQRFFEEPEYIPSVYDSDDKLKAAEIRYGSEMLSLMSRADVLLKRENELQTVMKLKAHLKRNRLLEGNRSLDGTQ